jgi:hypothetical protein
MSMTNRNNAAQAMTEKLWRSCVTAASLAPTTGSVVVESSTILAIDNVLSALRAEDAQASDERAAFEAYVQKRFGGLAEPWDANAARYPYGPDQARWEAWRDGRAALASAPVADDVQVMLKDPAIVHTNMCRGIIAPITFDMLAHVLGDEATAAWLDSRRVSAPVAREVVAWRVTHPRWPQTGWRDASRESAPSLNEVKQQDADLALELAYAAPQASEAVPIVFPAHLRRMWSGGEVQAWLDEHQGITPPKASASGRMKRCRKCQADQTHANQVGGDCSKGAGEASSPVARVPHTALQLEDLSRQVERDIHRFGTNVHVGVPAGVLRSMLHTLHAPIAGEARKMLADEEALDGVAEWLKQHDLTVNVGAAIEPAQDVHIESSAGWLLRLLTALNSAPHAIEAATAAAHASALQSQRKGA